MVRRRRLDDLPCSIARSLDVIGEWWTPLVLRDIAYGLHRFEAIAADLPIARNVLSDRLKALVEAGLLETRPYQQSPLRVEYHLTESGVDTFGVLLALMAWGDRWANPEGAPPVSVLCRGCSSETVPQVTCGSCGDRLSLSTVGVRANLGQDTPTTRLRLRRD